MFNQKTYEFQLNNSKFKVESGVIANNAQASLLITYGETCILLVLAVGQANKEADFVPLSVEYVEKLYASGKIFSSQFIKREGKPTDLQILHARLIDHAIRSLLPASFRNEIQIVSQVLSFDQEHDPVLASMVGTSFLLYNGGVPIKHTYGATKMGYIATEDQFLVNPTNTESKLSDLTMFVSSTVEGVVSVEADCNNIPEDKVKKCIEIAVEENNKLIQIQEEFITSFGKLELDYYLEDEEAVQHYYKEINEKNSKKLAEAVNTKEKKYREKALELEINKILENYKNDILEEKVTERILRNLIEKILKNIVRQGILQEEKRPDGRKIDEVRPLNMRVGVLPRVHGSALFSRGETQTLSIITLGSDRDAQLLDDIYGENYKAFFHHYNMPGYANGEVDRRLGFPNRRAIGHGNIGENAMKAVIQTKEFPYTIRVVSEVMASNGSTSMASTCSGMLALMDAGVPITDMVAAIGVGLVYQSEKEYKILTDIQGIEDFYGDMDFKVCGTKTGITAIQLDNKMAGIPVEVLFQSIDKSKTARLQVLAEMGKCLEGSRTDVSKYAPKIKTITVDPDKIRLVIGPSGKNIKSIVDQTGVDLNIAEDNSGTITMYAADEEKFKQAMLLISQFTEDLISSEAYQAKVIRVNNNFGLIVQIEGTSIAGMVHISKLNIDKSMALDAQYKVGNEVKVTNPEKDKEGRYRFSLA